MMKTLVEDSGICLEKVDNLFKYGERGMYQYSWMRYQGLLTISLVIDCQQ